MNTQRCQCCLSENCYKDINNVYFRSGKTEIYSKMLLETFDIRVADYDGKSLICEECITKLREAIDFKHQVLQAQAIFFQSLTTIKLELPAAIDNLQSECDENQPNITLETHYTELEDDQKVENEGFADNNWNRQCQGQTLVVKVDPKQIIQDKVNFMDNEKNVIVEYSNTNKTNRRKCIKEGIKSKTVQRNKIPKVNKVKSLKTKPSNRQTKHIDAHKHQRENTIKLLLNSNVCLFTSYKTKFGCYLCKERFLDIKTLREHTKTHSNDKYIVSSVNHLRGLSYKNVDISNLACKMCEQTCQDLTELQTHLSASHGVEFSGSDNFLTPYKLENGLQCTICRQKFNTFLRLSIHMNTHSTNNVCEICGMSYINRSSLRLHVQALHREKTCTLCPSNFLNNSTKVKHMRTVHGLADYKRHCSLCEKTFRYSYLLLDHNIKDHGAKRSYSECGECGKKFPSENNLKVHIRNVHVKERNFPCSACDMRFFTKFDKQRHERTHEDARSFPCAHCDTRFKTKDSWRRHTKRQHDARPTT
ncbi:zinc finger protein 808-like [Manduca sexta]|uniref:zinc finger protein 808-like n=1 Tax=Manduca sexta TaxID=7130 RepID=UPI0018907A21|nr:zinc finger protein 808-like [Manduca sexta]